MAFTAIFVQEDDVIDYTPTGNVNAGDVIVQGSLVAIAKRPIPANTLGSLSTEGVFDMPKATTGGSGIAAGTKVYWDGVDGVVTASANNGATPPVAYPYVGKTVSASADADTTARVRLGQDA